MLGDLIPVMTGVAMAGRYLGQKIVAMTWIGDGGSSTGAFHEGMNFAAAQQRAARGDARKQSVGLFDARCASKCRSRISPDRAEAYGIASMIVDGNDVVAVYDASKEAVDQCRAGRGPVLIEVKTMRMKGHAQHDPAEYVPKEMFDYWKARDPIARYEEISHREQSLGREEKSRNRRAHRTRTGRRSEIRRGIAAAAAGIGRAGRLLRGLPHHRSRMEARRRTK